MHRKTHKKDINSNVIEEVLIKPSELKKLSKQNDEQYSNKSHNLEQHDKAHDDTHDETHAETHDEKHTEQQDEVHDEKHDETHAETHDETHDETHAETHDEQHDETHVETHAETHDETHAEAHDEQHDETHAETHAETHDETHVETHAEAHDEQHAETHAEQHDEQQDEVHDIVNLEVLENANSDTSSDMSDMLELPITEENCDKIINSLNEQLTTVLEIKKMAKKMSRMPPHKRHELMKKIVDLSGIEAQFFEPPKPEDVVKVPVTKTFVTKESVVSIQSKPVPVQRKPRQNAAVNAPRGHPSGLAHRAKLAELQQRRSAKLNLRPK